VHFDLPWLAAYLAILYVALPRAAARVEGDVYHFAAIGTLHDSFGVGRVVVRRVVVRRVVVRLAIGWVIAHVTALEDVVQQKEYGGISKIDPPRLPGSFTRSRSRRPCGTRPNDTLQKLS
jgi:hypothetical protein